MNQSPSGDASASKAAVAAAHADLPSGGVIAGTPAEDIQSMNQSASGDASASKSVFTMTATSMDRNIHLHGEDAQYTEELKNAVETELENALSRPAGPVIRQRLQNSTIPPFNLTPAGGGMNAGSPTTNMMAAGAGRTLTNADECQSAGARGNTAAPAAVARATGYGASETGAGTSAAHMMADGKGNTPANEAHDQPMDAKGAYQK